jgi:hypothetical protein
LAESGESLRCRLGTRRRPARAAAETRPPDYTDSARRIVASFALTMQFSLRPLVHEANQAFIVLVKVDAELVEHMMMRILQLVIPPKNDGF